ncbi:hypothetical protein ANN_26325 [Periplaneta americana]|uniref:Uncharacterized protein n=1 Tax=Periplaneta americana TaxID=6978 RepID=A0ABQ8S673_PERAM|nr:hypothetical protein ANN_26325 [Periplaneta americana]
MAAISSQQCQPKKFSGKDVSIQLHDNSIHQNKSLSNKDSATNNFHPNSKIMNPKATPSNQVTYSKVLQSTPSRDQAIIIESSDNITIKDYVLAVAKFTDPSNIRFISRISNGRISIYLASKKNVEELTTKYQRIMINNESLQLRPFLTKYKRVILSNVCPVIPHSLIEESLLQFDVKPTSPIEYIKAGISTPGFSHILSFRHQMYVQPDDFEKLPESMLISPTELARRNSLYQKGLELPEINTNSHTQPELEFLNTEEFPPLPNRLSPNSNKQKNVKRAVTSSDSTIQFSDDSEELLNNIPNEDATIPILTQKEKSKPPKKKAKTLNSPSIDQSLLSIRTVVESSPNDYVLNFLQLKSFYENSEGTTDTLDVAKSHTHDIEGLIDTLHKLYPHFKSQNMKNKTTRILTKLTSHSNAPEHDTLI